MIIPMYFPHPKFEILLIISLKSKPLAILSCAIILFSAIIWIKNAIMNSIIEIINMTESIEELCTNAIPTDNIMAGMILYAKATMKYFIPFLNIFNISSNPGRLSFFSIENLTISYSYPNINNMIIKLIIAKMVIV